MKVQIGSSGTEFSDISDKGCRTQQQYKAFLLLMEMKQFKFLCLDPFKKDFPTESYKTSFALTGYNYINQCKVFWITPTGIIKDQQKRRVNISRVYVLRSEIAKFEVARLKIDGAEIEIDYGLEGQPIGEEATKHNTVVGLLGAIKEAESVLNEAINGSWAELFDTETGKTVVSLRKDREGDICYKYIK